MENKKYFTIALRHIMNSKKITQKVLGENINVDQRHISALLNNKKNFSDSKKEQIANFFGTTHLDMLILGRELSKSAESALLTPTQKEPSALLGNHAADDHPDQDDQPGSGETDPKDRMIEKITQMLREMNEEELRELEGYNQRIIEKKRMKEELETIRRELEKRKAG
ncbi:MAG: helix-turn-helix domain-containing protein [Desulfococcaceae bacterium]